MIVVPADREIAAIDSGYFRVSQIWLIEFYEANRRLVQQLEECREAKQ